MTKVLQQPELWAWGQAQWKGIQTEGEAENKNSKFEVKNIFQEREAAIATLEGEVADLLGKLNLLENKRDR